MAYFLVTSVLVAIAVALFSLDMKQVVAGGAADVLDVVGAHALLAGHGVGMLRGAEAEVISLEGHHARDGEEQGGIVGQEREAGVVVAALLLPEPDESFMSTLALWALTNALRASSMAHVSSL